MRSEDFHAKDTSNQDLCMCGCHLLSHHQTDAEGRPLEVKPCFYNRPEREDDCGCTGFKSMKGEVQDL